LYPAGFKGYLKNNVRDISKETSKPSVVLLGDSRIFLWPAPETAKYRIINRGIWGETSAQTLLRFHQHVAYLKPDIIILQIGVNDCTLLPLPPKTTRDVIKNCKENIGLIVENAQEIGATVIVSTIFPLGEGGFSLLQKWTSPKVSEITGCLDEVNMYIRSLNKHQNVIVFDAYAELEENGVVKPEYSEDLLHINARGYELLNKKLIMVIDTL
jgi:lysophospholipase L1-like esterase